MPPPLDGVDESPYRGHDDIAGDHRGDLLVRIYVEPRPTSKKARIAIAAALAAAAATALGLLL